MSWTEEQIIPNPNYQYGTNELFGRSIAISEDGTTLVIGTPGDPGVYVFVKSGNAWVQQFYSTGSARFGSAVTISSDGNMIAVGQENQVWGFVTLFSRSGSTWSSAGVIQNQDSFDEQWFGYAISLSGDGNTIAIGAPYAAHPDSYDGRVYIYTYSGGESWAQRAVLETGVAGTSFGRSVSFSNGTGNNLLIGAPTDRTLDTDGTIGNHGALYSYTGSGSSWTLRHYVRPTSPGVSEQFGTNVSISGDAKYATIGTNGAGKAYAYTINTSGVLSPQHTFTGGLQYSYFGQYVDINTDGSKVIVGEWNGLTEDGTGGGAAYTYGRNGTTWTLEQRLEASDSASSDHNGYSVSIDGEGAYGFTGAPDAEFGTNGASSSGIVYVFKGGPPTPDVTGITKIGATPSCTYPSTGTCSSSRQYSATVADASIVDSYSWSVTNNASISAGQGTDTVTVSTTSNTWQTVTITCVVTNETGSDSTTTNDIFYTELQPPNVLSITPLGAEPVCEYPFGGTCTTARSYRVDTSDPGGVSTYTWTLTGSNVSILSGQGSTILTVSLDADSSDNMFNIACRAANPSGSRTLNIDDTHGRSQEVQAGNPILPGPFAFEAPPPISSISPQYDDGLVIASAGVNAIVNGLNDVWADNNKGTTGLNAASTGYGQENYGNTGGAIPNVTAGQEVTNEQWNKMFDVVRQLSAHQGATVPEEIPAFLEDGDDIVAYDSLVYTINQLRTNKMNYIPTQMLVTTGGTGAISTRTTSWTNSVEHLVTATFTSWDHMRYFFNTGGQIRFSASRFGGSDNVQNDSMTALLNAVGTVKLAYAQTLRDDNLPGSNIGFYDLSTSNQLIYQATGSGAYVGDLYGINAKLNSAAGSATVITFRIVMLEDFDGTSVDGTTTSMVDYQIADSDEVSVAVPVFATTNPL